VPSPLAASRNRPGLFVKSPERAAIIGSTIP
jgi:hypothetical protein